MCWRPVLTLLLVAGFFLPASIVIAQTVDQPAASIDQKTLVVAQANQPPRPPGRRYPQGRFDRCSPDVPRRPQRAFYMWQDCDGRWHARAGSRSLNRQMRLTGAITSTGEFQNVSGFDMETNDLLDTSETHQVLVDFVFTGEEYDGFDFDVPTGSSLCVDVKLTDGRIDGRVGKGMRRVQGPFNPVTMRPCS